MVTTQFTASFNKETGSDIAKKQEVGRGLRLPVDVSGARCYDSAINELTIVANDYYDHFADSLQNDYNQSSGFNKEEVTADIIKRTIIEAGVPEDKVEDAYDALKRELVASEYVKVDKSGKIIMQTSEDDFNTFENYKYMYNTFVRPSFGKKRIQTLKKSDVKIFYNYLADQRCLQASTIDSIHTVLHQVLDMAVDDKYIRNNPSDKALKELKQSHAFKTEKRRALTIAEQELFLNYLRNNETYSHWYPIFAVMLGTGMRVGEITGLRWCDIDIDNGVIDINHTLVYYCHRHEVELNGCYFNINTPKTKASNRKIPMIESVKEAFLMEKANQEKTGIKCSAVIDGYSDFIFVNRNGKTQHQGTLNKAIRRIIRDCNDEVLLNDENATVLLPHFSCHSLRHTFSTRMCEAGINVKVIQDTLGHQDISTTMNIYTDATKEMKKQEFESLDNYLKKTV